MTWGKLDDHLDVDPRFVGIAPDVAGAFLLTLPHCLRADDPVIPTTYTELYAAQCDELIRRRIWEAAGGGAARIAPDLWANLSFPEEKRAKKRAAAHARWNAGAVQVHSNSTAAAEQPVSSSYAVSRTRIPSVSNETVNPPTPQGVQQVFDVWREVTGHPRAILTPARVRVARARIREGFTVEDLEAAVRGVALDPWPDRVQHNDFGQVLRDAAHVEKFRALWIDGPPVAVAPHTSENPLDRRLRERLERFSPQMTVVDGVSA